MTLLVEVVVGLLSEVLGSSLDTRACSECLSHRPLLEWGWLMRAMVTFLQISLT